MRALRAEIWLQLKYMEKMFRSLLIGQDSVTEEQLLTIRLACISISMVTDQLKTPVFDQDLMEKIKLKFSIKEDLPEEPCAVCSLDILFS